MKQHSRVWFRMYHMPCCGHLLCWVNPRIPSYCPECGKQVLRELKTEEHTKINDADAELNYNG